MEVILNISELWQENADFVLKVIQRFVGDKMAAEDIRQEVFLKIINRGKSFKKNCSVKTWLYSIAYRCCMDFFRKEKRRQHITNEISRTENLYLSDSQFPIWSVNDIAEVPCPISHLFVELRYGEDWSREEISQVFGYSVDYISKKIQIGLQQLREML
jgi:RNA polymerase sigma-70 factor (ECF subfamily)